MIKMKLERATIEHVYPMAINMAHADITELTLLTDFAKTLEGRAELLKHALERCPESTYVITLGELVVAMGGIDDLGKVWLLMTKMAGAMNRERKRQLYWMLKENIVEGTREYARLSNMMWTGNSQHVALVKSLGAHFVGEVVHNGERFHCIEFHREDYHQVNWGG